MSYHVVYEHPLYGILDPFNGMRPISRSGYSAKLDKAMGKGAWKMEPITPQQAEALYPRNAPPGSGG